MPSISINTVAVDDMHLFYREAGSKTQPVILLLHGYPSSSHQFRHLIPLLSTKYRVLAPDLPGFGFTVVPADRKYVYTFENLAATVEAFLDVLEIKEFSLYIFDYGAPTGLRLAIRRPQSIQAIVSQNGNAYVEGLEEFWDPLRMLWKSGAISDREMVKNAVLTFETTKWQYTNGAKSLIAPESYHLDWALISPPANQEIQLDLFEDYKTNVALYPKFHEYFRNSQVPLLAAWGKNDTIFVPAGAQAYTKDLPNAEVYLLDTGHFALETHVVEIAELIFEFLAKNEI